MHLKEFDHIEPLCLLDIRAYFSPFQSPSVANVGSDASSHGKFFLQCFSVCRVFAKIKTTSDSEVSEYRM